MVMALFSLLFSTCVLHFAFSTCVLRVLLSPQHVSISTQLFHQSHQRVPSPPLRHSFTLPGKPPEKVPQISRRATGGEILHRRILPPDTARIRPRHRPTDQPCGRVLRTPEPSGLVHGAGVEKRLRVEEIHVGVGGGRKSSRGGVRDVSPEVGVRIETVLSVDERGWACRGGRGGRDGRGGVRGKRCSRIHRVHDDGGRVHGRTEQIQLFVRRHDRLRGRGRMLVAKRVRDLRNLYGRFPGTLHVVRNSFPVCRHVRMRDVLVVRFRFCPVQNELPVFESSDVAT